MNDFEILKDIRSTDFVKNAYIDNENKNVIIEFKEKELLYSFLRSRSFIMEHSKETDTSLKLISDTCSKLIYLLIKDNVRCGRYKFKEKAEDMENLLSLADCYDYDHPVRVDKYDIYSLGIDIRLKDTFIENIEEICELAYFRDIDKFYDQDYIVIKKVCENKNEGFIYQDIIINSMEESSVINERLWNLFNLGILRMR